MRGEKSDRMIDWMFDWMIDRHGENAACSYSLVPCGYFADALAKAEISSIVHSVCLEREMESIRMDTVRIGRLGNRESTEGTNQQAFNFEGRKRKG